MSDIEVDIRTDENVHGVTDPSAAGPATQSRYNRDLLSPIFNKKKSVLGHFGHFGSKEIFDQFYQVEGSFFFIFSWAKQIFKNRTSVPSSIHYFDLR